MDDLLPQPSWPEDHAPKVLALIADLESHREFVVTKLAWASGLMIVVRLSAAQRAASNDSQTVGSLVPSPGEFFAA